MKSAVSRAKDVQVSYYLPWLCAYQSLQPSTQTTLLLLKGSRSLPKIVVVVVPQASLASVVCEDGGSRTPGRKRSRGDLRAGSEMTGKLF